VETIGRKLDAKKPEMGGNNMEKPVAKIIGANGNIFVIVGICSKALKRAGMDNKAKELVNRAFDSSSYEEALSICLEYITPE